MHGLPTGRNTGGSKARIFGDRELATIHHTLQWLPIVLRVKSQTFTRPARLLVMFSVLDSPVLTVTSLSLILCTPPYYSFLLWPCTLSFGIPEHADPSVSSFVCPSLHPLFHCLLKPQLNHHLLGETFPGSLTRSGSAVICLFRMPLCPLRALSWAFNYQSISVTGWWMSVFSALTLSSRSTKTMSAFAHHYTDRRQHNTLNLVDLQ